MSPLKLYTQNYTCDQGGTQIFFHSEGNNISRDQEEKELFSLRQLPQIYR